MNYYAVKLLELIDYFKLERKVFFLCSIKLNHDKSVNGHGIFNCFSVTLTRIFPNKYMFIMLVFMS